MIGGWSTKAKVGLVVVMLQIVLHEVILHFILIPQRLYIPYCYTYYIPLPIRVEWIGIGRGTPLVPIHMILSPLISTILYGVWCKDIKLAFLIGVLSWMALPMMNLVLSWTTLPSGITLSAVVIGSIKTVLLYLMFGLLYGLLGILSIKWRPKWRPFKVEKVGRPLGVTILAVFGMIFGSILTAGGVYYILRPPSPPAIVGGAAALAAGFGVLFLIIAGPIVLLLGWGFWKGKGWARTTAIIFYVIGILNFSATVLTELMNFVTRGIMSVGQLMSFAIQPLMITLLCSIVYYLFRPNVKVWFGKAKEQNGKVKSK